MKHSPLSTLTISSIFLLLAACSDKPETNKPITTTPSSAVSISSPASMSTAAFSSATSSAPTTSVATDAWLGKWIGPEGTFLEISGGNGSYEITIQDLDGPIKYQGTSSGNGNQISFERNGATETIQASTGAETGMKWLAEKSNCLRVREGEGWCKD